MKRQKSSKTLVVFYSRTGNTKKIGHEIAKALKADFEEIIEIGSRRGFFRFLGSGFEAFKEKCSRIKPLSRDTSKYKKIIIGTPVWAGNITPALRTFLKTNDLKNKKMHLFFTSGSGNISKAANSVKLLLPVKFSREILSLKEQDVKQGNYKKELKSFIKKIKK